MPRQSTTTSSTHRLENLFESGATATRLLRDVSDNINDVPFLKTIAGVGTLILETAQSVKTNKDECMRLIERAEKVIYALIQVWTDPKVQLSPEMLRNVAQFTETLQKILSFVRANTGGKLMRRILRHAEDVLLLKQCQDGLTHALNVFSVQADILGSAVMAKIQSDAVARHEELLNILTEKNISQETFDSVSQTSSRGGSLRRSSSTLSLLPASPKIFYGREKEMELITDILSRPHSSNIAILGPGGIGKSSLALTILHSPESVTKFDAHRYFVSCDAAASHVDVASAIAAYLGLEQQAKVAKAVIRHLSAIKSPILLVLDNIETPWESLETRAQVEEFLSLLTDVQQLNLVVTMRGAERPMKVKWARPFLSVLEPLDSVSARNTFLDIADDVYSDDDLKSLLDLTDNLPLAVTIMANVVSFEGASSVLDRWRSESTSLLSSGLDRTSNLDRSIMVSLSSPRILQNPGAKELLALLSLLPDGATPATLEQMKLPLPGLQSCKTALLRTSLAYVGHDERIRILVPIREYVRKTVTPSPTLVQPAQAYLYDLMQLFENWEQNQSSGVVQRLAADLSNLRSVVQYALDNDAQTLSDTVRCVLQLAKFARFTELSSLDLILRPSFETVVMEINDVELQGEYFLALAHLRAPNLRIEDLASKAIQCFSAVGNVSGQAAAYITLSFCHTRHGRATDARKACEQAVQLSEKSGDRSLRSRALARMAETLTMQGQHKLAFENANESQIHAKAAGDLFREAHALLQQLICCLWLGKYPLGISIITEVFSLANALGLERDSLLYRQARYFLAEIHSRKTEYGEAQQIYTSIEARSRENGDPDIARAYSLISLASCEIATTNPPSSFRDKVISIQNILTPGEASGYYAGNIVLGDFYSRRKEYGTARELYLQCLDTGMRNVDVELVVTTFEKLADVSYSEGLVMQALRYSILQLAVAKRTENAPSTHQALRRLGDFYAATKDDDTAGSLFKVALDGFTQMDVQKARGDCLLRMGDLWDRRGKVGMAKESYQLARASFERSSQPASVITDCDQKIAKADSN
ncbi:hypothetical protein C8J57DRAFT_1499782 [Mycena rebaudengoi]|nr:hypothetical protein C8J57DRAFT_1499782 [Mycena rebaudengoi]